MVVSEGVPGTVAVRSFEAGHQGGELAGAVLHKP